MRWLFDLLIDLLIPWGTHRDDRSIVGKSPIDRQAAWIARGLFILLIATVVAYALWNQ
jgi:hypothetical protein